MTKPLLATAAVLAAVATPASAAVGTACVDAAVYKITHNPVRPLPSGGGGGEPTMIMPGDPIGYVKYDVGAVTAIPSCLLK